MSEFDLGDSTYRIGKLDAFKQFHLSRKVAPIIPTLIPVFLKLQQSASKSPLSGDIGAMAEVMGPFADGIAAMPDEAAEFILGTCLAVVQRKQGDRWMPVWSSNQSTCMFDDMDLGVMLQLTFRVIKESLGPFISGMLSGQGTPKA
ncbi:hypothetical protein N5D52_14700 [Pseudomonas sp. GD03860]|uniref:phage tail assembly chaperone n=1 Tax=Pseudomonas sp. GD03860 TaxID=2975389 RepID=UPI00244C0E89|nr:hypothetical protein [Pseudomonas sp. GD03860]MDH0638194.1 hypothetical protein [Pseudomonas sp. GD03860]